MDKKDAVATGLCQKPNRTRYAGLRFGSEEQQSECAISFVMKRKNSSQAIRRLRRVAGGDNLEPRMRKPCAATISIFRVLSLHMFLQLFVLALNRFEAICQGRIDIGLTSQYHLQIVLCPLELILILLSSLFVCRNTFPVGWHPHQPK